MKRIIAVTALVLVIGALTAASALACVPLVGVQAPNPNGHAGTHPPSTHLVTCIPANQGTETALFDTPSPAITFCGGL